MITPELTRLLARRSARRVSLSWLRRSSWLSCSNRRITGNASSSRAATLTSIELSTFIRDTSCSGTPATSLSKVCSLHTTVPSGGLRSCGLLFFLACFSALIAAFFAADLAFAFSFSITCSGAWTTT